MTCWRVECGTRHSYRLILSQPREGRLGRHEHVQTFVSVPGYLKNLSVNRPDRITDESQLARGSRFSPTPIYPSSGSSYFNLEPIRQPKGRLRTRNFERFAIIAELDCSQALAIKRYS